MGAKATKDSCQTWVKEDSGACAQIQVPNLHNSLELCTAAPYEPPVDVVVVKPQEQVRSRVRYSKNC